MLSGLSRWLIRTLGWTLEVDLPDLRKYVVIAAPHTSNWDFPLGILVARAINLNIHWMGKHTIFRWPFGMFFRAIGGTPVQRDRGQNHIQQMADLFDRSGQMVLALAPEGTRSKTDHWKTGFHYIARAAKVPIVMCYLDFRLKQVGVGGMFYPGNDIEMDFKWIREFYAHKRGKNPENESLIRVRRKTGSPHITAD